MKKLLKNKNKCLILFLVVIIGIGILMYYLNGKNGINKIRTQEEKAAEENIEVYYEKKKINSANSTVDILVNITSDKGIKKITKPDGIEITPTNTKNKISIDLEGATEGVDYKYTVEGETGKVEEKIINIKKIGEIYTVEDLEEINLLLSANYKLMNNIDFSDINSYRSKEKYEYYTVDSDGDGYPDNKFQIAGTYTGTLDGQGYTIRNYKVNTNENYSGIFRKISNATIENLLIKDADINSNADHGASILVGEIEKNSTFKKLGITGNLHTGVNTTSWISAFGNGVSGANIQIDNCYSKTNIEGIGNFIYDIGGVVVEYRNTGKVTCNNCYYAGVMIGHFERMGNFVGGYTIENNDNQHGRGILNNCYYDNELFTHTVKPCGTGLTTAQMKDSNNYVGWDFTNTWSIDPNVNDGYPELKF